MSLAMAEAAPHLAPFLVERGYSPISGSRQITWCELSTRESIETALYLVFRAHFSLWRVKNSTGRIVASNEIGILPELDLSLLARQILSKLLPQFHPVRESLGNADTCTDAYMWNGESWSLLPDPNGKTATSTPTAEYRQRGVKPPVVAYADDPGFIQIHHSTGSMRIDRRFLELRAERKGTGTHTYNLVILNRTSEGKPGTTSSGVFVTGLDQIMYDVLTGLGVRTQTLGDPNAPPKAWKRQSFHTLTHDHQKIERLGWVRAHFAIDKRLVEFEGYTQYCLTHLPTGYLIQMHKHKNAMEELADALLVEVPELATLDDSQPADSAIGQKVQAVVNRLFPH